jgi:hypothetical protein
VCSTLGFDLGTRIRRGRERERRDEELTHWGFRFRGHQTQVRLHEFFTPWERAFEMKDDGEDYLREESFYFMKEHKVWGLGWTQKRLRGITSLHLKLPSSRWNLELHLLFHRSMSTPPTIHSSLSHACSFLLVPVLG